MARINQLFVTHLYQAVLGGPGLRRDVEASCRAIAAQDRAGRRLALDSLWINILEPGGYHTAHIHSHAAISGTYYVGVPAGASAIRFEDPRLAMLMAAPPRRCTARLANRTFVDIVPRPGSVLLWESNLRHEVPVNRARRERISICFNFRWG